MDDLFSTAGKVAGLGGLCIAVVVLLFRQTIAENILKTLSEEARERILRLTIGGSFVLAALGLVSYTFSTTLSTWADRVTLWVGGDLKVGGDATLRGTTKVGKDVDIKQNLEVNPPDERGKTDQKDKK
jgi:hypothetical protein